MMTSFSNSSGHYAGGYDDQTSGAGSSSNPLLKQDYEVFLSFSGDDTRYGFTDHLYRALVNRGIRVFRDSESLRVGQEIDKLIEAIMASKILVPIISTHYASSKWCLKELVKILKCNKSPDQSILPIYYKVKTSDVRDQKGRFGKEFRKFKQKHNDDIELVQESKQAFNKILSLKGWESDKFADKYEGPLVEAIVKRISNELRKPILHVPEFLVGVEEHVKEIMEMIHAKKSNDAKIIAFHGMGGIGKTTLAKALYNKLSNRFDSCSFVPNIREASSTDKGMVDLQKHVISDILADKLPQEISHVDDGITIMEKSFKGKRLLLLLDDVNDNDQLKKLAVKNNWLGLESIVIITTRNKDVAEASAKDLSYEVNKLDENQSYELFCKHAFGREASCPSNLEHIVRGIVSTIDGLPLAIEIIGSLLYQKSDNFWSTTLKKLRRIPNDKVLERLKLSYDALTHEQQQIFLDIACFSRIHYKLRYALYMWDACEFYPEEGIEMLRSLSLIKVGDENIIIHDQLRDLGREIVRREGRSNIGMCSRLCLPMEAKEVLERKLGTTNIQALRLYTGGKKIHLTSQHFEGMKNLRFLDMSRDVHLKGDFENVFSNIRWLRWCYPFNGNISGIMGINFSPKKLVILELWAVNITEHWSGWNQVKNLKVLHLQWCPNLTTTPDFSAVKGLEKLVLRDCSGLKKVHPSIRQFRKTLKVLDVSHCSQLEELQIKVGEMEQLRVFGLWGTAISGIKRIEYHLDTVGSCVKLLTLDLSYCRSLINIPEAIGKLNWLTSLILRHTGVTQLPDSIGDLHDLERFDICSTPIKYLPASVEKLSKLQHLNLANSKKLESLPNLPCGLTFLSFNGDSMETLPDISNLTNLKRFHYQDDFKRRNRALNLGEMNQLEILEILDSVSLFERSSGIDLDEASEDINLLLELPLSLKTLEVRGCRTLQTFPSLPNMKNLSEFTLGLNCLELKGGESLTYLHIKRRRKLSKLSGIGSMVTDLLLGFLDALQSSPNILALKKLKNLQINNCSNLVEIQGLEDVECLETLIIENCCSLEIANLSHLKMLATLKLHKCEKLSNIQGIDKLTSLTKLDIFWTLLDSLDLSALKKLKDLMISNCNNLVEIQGLEDIEVLETLRIQTCRSIERIANLSHLKMLTTLELHECEKLSNVQGIDKLTSLTRLCIPKPLQDSLDPSQLANLQRSQINRKRPSVMDTRYSPLEVEEESRRNSITAEVTPFKHVYSRKKKKLRI